MGNLHRGNSSGGAGVGGESREGECTAEGGRIVWRMAIEWFDVEDTKSLIDI